MPIQRIPALLLILALAAWPAAARADASHDANAAIKAQSAGDLIRAHDLYTRVIDSGELNPGEALLLFVHNNRAVIHRHWGQYESAIADFTAALQQRPDPTVFVNRGEVWVLLGREDKAIEDFNSALRYNPDYARAFYSRGFALLNQGRNQEALQDLDQARRLKPSLKPPL